MGVMWQVEVREVLAARGADLERQTQTAARHSAELTLARRKLVDGAAALAEAQSAAAVLRGDADHGAAALRREQGEVARLQAALAAAQQQAARAKHLRDAQAGPCRHSLYLLERAGCSLGAVQQLLRSWTDRRCVGVMRSRAPA